MIENKWARRQYPLIPVIMGSNINALGVIRDLGREGVFSFIVDETESVAGYSKYKLEWSPESVSLFEKLIELGKKMKEKGEKGFLIPTTDEYVEFIAENRRRLSVYYELFIEEDANLALYLNKSKIYPILDKLGIDYPKGIFVQEASDLYEAEKLRFPLIVKPENTVGFTDRYKKTMSLENKEDIPKLIAELKEAHLEERSLIVQEWIPGEDTQLFSYASYSKKGRIFAEAEYYKLRQYPPGAGTATASVYEKNMKVKLLGRKLIEALKYTGIEELEFKLDPRDQKYKFIEMNARTWMSISAMSDLGIPLVTIAFLDACGLYTYEGILQSDLKRVWILDFEDFIRTTYSNKKRYPEHALSFRKWRTSIKDKKSYAIFDKKDIKPWLVKVKSFFKKG